MPQGSIGVHTVTPDARDAFWIERLRGARADPLLRSGPPVDLPDPAHTLEGSGAAVERLSGGDPVGLLLLTVAATRLALRALTGHAEHTVVCPAPDGGEVALRAPLDPARPAVDFLNSLNDEFTAAVARPWDERAALAARLDAIGAAEGAALSQIAVVWAGTYSASGLRAPSELTVLADRPEAGGAIRIRLMAPSRQPHAAVTSLGRCIAAALDALAADPARPLGELDALGESQRTELLAWSALPCPDSYPAHTMLDAVAESARRRPEHPAVVDEAGTLTYRELITAVNQAANILVSNHGVARGDRVALLMPRGRGLVIGMLAAWAAGAVCVPLDPDHPRARLEQLADRAAPRVALIAEHSPDAFVPSAATAVTLAELTEPQALAVSDESEPRPALADHGVRPGDDAVLFFTSGSTGAPRPVLIWHDQLAHKATSSAALLGIDDETRCALLAAITSDGTVYHVTTTLGVGGTVVAIGRVEELDPHTFWRRLAEARVNLVNCVPAVLAAMLSGLPADAGFSLRHLLLGGDAIPPGLMARTAGRLRVGTFVNLYGPCEATIEAMTFLCPGEQATELTAVPIGRPSPGFAILLLDAERELVPVGAEGEIYIAGPGVAAGYLDDPQASAERFVQLPQAGHAFRTGDFARRLPDGQLMFLGRRDGQVQVNGHRVELGEVERALVAVPGVRDAVVVPDEVDGGTRLVGWFVADPEAAASAPSADLIRRQLRSKLPAHLVPSELRTLPEIPRSVHGKVDRAALAALAKYEAVDAVVWAPTDPVERLVADAWRAVLGRAPRSAEEDFFDGGGQSLAAARLASALCEGAETDSMSVRAVFTARTPAALAAALRLAGPGRAPVAGAAPVPLAGRTAPASNAQRRMWLLDRLDDGEVRAYNMVEAYQLPDDLGEQALRSALRALAVRHEALRTRFAEYGDRLLQVVGAADDAPDVLRVRRVDAGQLDQALADETEVEYRHRFDLAAGPLHRALLLSAPDRAPVLLLNIHHLVSDGWSFAVLVRDLLRFADHGESGLDAQAPGYIDHCHALDQRLSGPEGDADRAFWLSVLSDAPQPPALPTDRRRPPVRTNAGGLVRVPLGSAATRGIRALSRETGASPFMVMVAVTRVLLHRLSGADDVLFGSVVAGRGGVRTGPGSAAEAMGLFVNTVVLRTRLDPQAPFRELVRAVRETGLAAAEHEDYPFDLVVDGLAVHRDPSRNPVFDVFVETVLSDAVLSGTGNGTGTGDGDDRSRQAIHLAADPPISTFDLSFSFLEPDRETDAEVWIGYCDDIFDRATAERIGAQYRALLEGLVDAPDLPVSTATLLPPDQRRFLIVDCNDTAAPFPADRTLLDLVEGQVAAHPQSPAVHHGDVTLSFAELDARAELLAARLRAACAAEPGALVAVVLHRTEWMVAALHAILKTGAAFLPLDPEQPPSRLAAILATARPVAVLADGAYRSKVEGLVEVPVLDPTEPPHTDETATSPRASGASVSRRPGPNDLAYVIFTSGSTGTPKGVMIEHRGIVNTVHYRAGYYGFDTAASVLQVPPIHFDSGVNDVFSALVAGTPVTVAEREELFRPDTLAALIRRHRISHIMLVPSLYQLMLEGDAEALRGVRQVVLVGERLPEALAARHAALLPDTVLYNEYGPTEDSVWTTVHRITDAAGDVLIGHPISNKTVDLLDADDELVPLGVPGQICIGGVGLARGYLGDPELTARRFTADPSRPGGRIYRTGDLARRRADGVLQFLGRIDDQVKIRGQRVEPGEVAAVLGGAPGVEQCAVIAHRGENGETRLIAYVAGQSRPAEWRCHLETRLPQVMLPSQYIEIDRLPITSNGKLDRAALPAPDRVVAQPSSREQNTADNAIERRLTSIWEKVLGVPVANLGAGLFELGGHSLSAARIAREVEAAYGVPVPLKAVFQHQSVREFAAYLEAQGHGSEQAATTQEPDSFSAPSAADPLDTADGRLIPLSYAQRGIWAATHTAPPSSFNIVDATALGRSIDPSTLRAALAAVVARHEMLRARLVRDSGPIPRQEVLDALPGGLPLDVVEVPPGTEPGSSAVRELILRLRDTEFDLFEAPLFAVRLIRGTVGGDLLAVAAHHLVYDAGSADLLFAELVAAYDQVVRDGAARLDSPAATYRDWIADEQRRLTQRGAADSAYWREQLADPPLPADLTPDRPRPATRGSQIAVLRHLLDKDSYAELKRAAAQCRATSFMALMSAFAVLVYRETGAEDMVLGFPSEPADRPRVVGVFTNPVALRLRLDAGLDRRALLERVRDGVLSAYQHADYPFELVVQDVNPRRRPGRGALFDLGVSWESAASAVDDGAGVVLFDHPPRGVQATADLWLYAREQGRQLVLELVYDRALFEEAEAERLFEDLLGSLPDVAADTPLATAPARAATPSQAWEATRYDF